MFRLLKVTGFSLYPDYQEGDFVLVRKIPSLLSTLGSGDVVIFQHPTYGTLIKRVERLSPNGEEIYVLGTVPESADSRKFGPIHKDTLIGKVVWHIRKPRRST